MYETIMVANQGGIVVPVQRGNFSTAIGKLITLLSRNEIDAFVVDKYEMMLYYHEYEGNPKYDDVSLMLEQTSLTELTQRGDFSYGMLLKEAEDYNFFKEFVSSNRDIINSCNNLLFRKATRDLRKRYPKYSIFTTEGEIFWPTFLSCAVMVTVIFVCGLAHELKRRTWSGEWKCQEQVIFY